MEKKGEEWVDSYMPLYYLGVYNISEWNGKTYKSYFPFLSFYFVNMFFMYETLKGLNSKKSYIK